MCVYARAREKTESHDTCAHASGSPLACVLRVYWHGLGWAISPCCHAVRLGLPSCPCPTSRRLYLNVGCGLQEWLQQGLELSNLRLDPREQVPPCLVISCLVSSPVSPLSRLPSLVVGLICRVLSHIPSHFLSPVSFLVVFLVSFLASSPISFSPSFLPACAREPTPPPSPPLSSHPLFRR